MSVGNIGRPLSQLVIPRSQLPNLVTAFKPLNTRLAVSSGISAKSSLPLPPPKPGGVATLPVPFSKPSSSVSLPKVEIQNIRHLQSAIKTAGRIVDNIDRSLKRHNDNLNRRGLLGSNSRRAGEVWSSPSRWENTQAATAAGWTGGQPVEMKQLGVQTVKAEQSVSADRAKPSDYSRKPGNPAGLSRVFDYEKDLGTAKDRLDAARKMVVTVDQLLRLFLGLNIGDPSN